MNGQTGRIRPLVAAVVAVVIAALIGVAGFGLMGGGGGEARATTASWCSYATTTNATGLLKLAEMQTQFGSLLTIADGYVRSAPPAIKSDMTEVVRSLRAMKDQPIPRTGNRDGLVAAARVDRFITNTCKRGTA